MNNIPAKEANVRYFNTSENDALIKCYHYPNKCGKCALAFRCLTTDNTTCNLEDKESIYIVIYFFAWAESLPQVSRLEFESRFSYEGKEKQQSKKDTHPAW